MKSSLASRSGRHPPDLSAPLEPDLRRAVELVMQLMAIPGKSGEEAQVREFIVSRLREAGAPASAIEGDDAHRRSPLPGQVGNLVLRLPGTIRAPRRMLMAHLDTVPLCVGSKPVKRGGIIRSADKTTGLGADDRGGCAVVLTAALEILRRRLPHPPLTFFWVVQEEVGLHGSQFGDLKRLGNPKLVFNWDGGPADKLTVGATGAYRIAIDVYGLASHAGGAPEQGISAVTIAGLAIADLERGGWLGSVRQGRHSGTSNIGIVRGGEATNVVTDHVFLKAEARSHDPRFRLKMLKTITQAFERSAHAVKNLSGQCGRVKITSQLDYEAFRLDAREPCVLAAEAAVRAVGGEPLRAITNGGLDANWMTARGMPTVTLGCGQRNVHTVSETLELDQFHRACRIGLRLATATEGG